MAALRSSPLDCSVHLLALLLAMDAFDFSERHVFTPNCFKSTVVEGPARLREVVRSIPSRDQAPFFGVLLSLGPQGSYVGSQWVGGGKLEAGVAFSAGAIFPKAAKGLSLSLVLDLDNFDFPLSGSNFSTYREAPYHVPVVAYLDGAGGQEVVSWERAKELGCRDFSIRLVVLVTSTKEVLVQVGAVPFNLEELRTDYGEVFDKPYFPNVMVRVTKVRTKLPDFMGAKSTTLAKVVDLVLEDSEGVGFGILPFTTCVEPVQGEVERPAVAAVKKALFSHMHGVQRPTAKTGVQMPASLVIALEADKNVQNASELLWSPWPVLDEGLRERVDVSYEGGKLLQLGDRNVNERDSNVYRPGYGRQVMA